LTLHRILPAKHLMEGDVGSLIDIYAVHVIVSYMHLVYLIDAALSI
jgi:hypothetical protein